MRFPGKRKMFQVQNRRKERFMLKLMAANWKMYKTVAESAAVLEALKKATANLPQDREAAIFAPFTALTACAAVLRGVSGLYLGGQDLYPAGEGAFTGEISPLMLKDAGCRFALTGHSERRAILGESDALIGRKTAFALENGLDVVLCVGETLKEREDGALERVLKTQIAAGTAEVPRGIDPARLSVAYEPVWAIGTGRVAGPREILEAHALARKNLHELFGRPAEHMRILYGGSVKPENAGEIIALDNVDGVLVGGASLQAESFSRIVLA
jgi:triosephosphate isomerase